MLFCCEIGHIIMMKVQNHMESFQVLAVEPNLEALMSDLASFSQVPVYNWRIRPKPLALEAWPQVVQRAPSQALPQGG